MADTKFCKSIENSVREEWAGTCIFNSFSSQARGVAIFIKKDCTANVIDKFFDTEGNILAILILFQGKKILLEGLYGPNTDSPNFYSEVAFKKIAEWQPDYSIFAGDFNVVLDPKIDTKNYLHVNNPLAMQELKTQMQNFNLIDIWRELHPDEKKYTWQKYNENKMSRLDYFLISSSLLPFVQNAEIVSGFCSDHSGITLEIDFSKFKRGKGFWKFNTSLLKDPDYLNKIKDTIKRVVAQYAIIDGDENFFTNATAQILQDFYTSSTPDSLQFRNLKINPQSFLDILLLEIRRETISFSAFKKRERQAHELLLLHDIEALEKQVSEETDEAKFEEVNTDLHNKRNELEDIYAHQAQGAFIRARARYKMEGEKPSKLFCALEKNNAVEKVIPKLIVDRNNQKVILTEQKEIENETHNFYKDLFSFKNNQIEDINEFLGPESAASCPKLSESQKQKMEGLLSLDELTRYLKKTKNNVSPGSSGFTNEFFKFFWIDLKMFVINAINYSYETGMLSVTQRLGIITLIPKGDKDKTFLKNWRPLTLLNSLYKLISGCIAERMKPHLDSIVHGDQKGFVAGRYIGEAIRTTYDIIQWAKDNNKTAVLLLIDFEKAYDSLSFSYIKKCLKFLNFGDSIIGWVELLLHNFSAVINHCGNISKRFNIERGARQGDPIASYLFIIAIEILAHKLRSDPNIQGLRISNQLTHTLELYADDCSIFLEPTEQNLRNAMETLGSFFNLSGLKISVTKTKAIWFGKDIDNSRKLCLDLQLDWVSKFTLLGINFHNNLENMDENFDNKIDEIEKLLNCWIYRTLTVYGKITVIKTLALSKLSHLALVLPDLDKKKLKIIENMFFKFLWGNKPDKVSRDHAKLSEKAGGLGLVDIKQFWESLKFSWFRRLVNSNAFWPKILEISVQSIIGNNTSIIDILQSGPNKLTFIGKKMHNKFWKQVFSAVTPFMQGALFCHPEKLFIAPFWDNPSISRNNKAIKQTAFPNLAEKINTISDFYHHGSGTLLTKPELENKYQIILSEETLMELHYIIKTARRSLEIKDSSIIQTFSPFQPLLINIVNLTKKGCGIYCKFLKKKKNLNSPLIERERKWHNELQCTFGTEFWNKTYAFTASIKHENKIKWLQFQINRGCLFTNHKVNKFKPHISPDCTYCSHVENFSHRELVSHLFWDCDFVLKLWQEIKTWLGTLGTNLPLSRTSLLFGIHDQKSSSVENYIILVAKHFIWKTKFTSKDLSLGLFQKYLKSKLEDIKNALIVSDKEKKFDQWKLIFDCLSRLPVCSAQTEAPLPVQAPAGTPDQPPTV